MPANISRASARNGQNNVETPPNQRAQREMAAFDLLPKATKRLISESIRGVCAQQVIFAFKRGMDVEDVKGLIADADRTYLLDVNMLPRWGDHHPQEIPTRHAPKSLKDLDHEH